MTDHRSFRQRLLDALTSIDGGPTEIMLGRLLHLESIRAGDHLTANPAGLAVARWRTRIFVLTYDRAGGAGCPACLAGYVQRHQVPGAIATDIGYPAPTRLADPAVEAIVLATALRLWQTAEPGTLATIDAHHGDVRYSRVPPRSNCQGHELKPRPTTIVLGEQPDLLVAADQTSRSVRSLPPDLDRRLLGLHTVFRDPLTDLDGPVPAAQVSVPLAFGGLEPGIGRQPTVAASRQTALLEGLERYSALEHQPPCEVWASQRELGQTAVDPASLGTHSKRQYARSGFPFAPLDPDERTDWIPVTSLGDGDTRLLPTAATYWAPRRRGQNAFFYDTSNGFALGRTVEEAALHGLLEVIERDAFLLTWYRELRLPELEVTSNDELWPLLQRVLFVTGFRIRLFWAALDTGVPVVIAVATNSSESGPQTFAASGASLFPRAAARSAILEVSAILAAVSQNFRQHEHLAERMAMDHGQVQTMEDHSLVGASRGAVSWFDFLSDPDRERINLDALGGVIPSTGDISSDLDEVVLRVLEVGSPILVADVTCAEVRHLNLVCTRTLVPGFVPMTFGHQNRRLTGLPRLTEWGLPYESNADSRHRVHDRPPHPFP